MQKTSTKYEVEKPGLMPDGQLIQLLYETDTMKRVLGFMADENIHLKNSLSELLKGDFDKNLLDEVELFLSRFIKEDELISLLRSSLSELDKLLMKNVFEKVLIKKGLYKKIKSLGSSILIAERHFNKLKWEFNNYLSENC